MLAILLACTLLCSGVLGDDPLVDKAKEVVDAVNHYLSDHRLNDLPLADVGIFSFDPVKLRNGALGNLSSIQIHGEPTITKTTNEDGSTSYDFDLKLGLQQLLLHFDFEVSLFGYLPRKGHVVFEAEENEAEVAGSVLIATNGSCDAMLNNLSAKKLWNFKADIKPSFPMENVISAMILNYASPKMLTLINNVLQVVAFTPIFQDNFVPLVCTPLSN